MCVHLGGAWRVTAPIDRSLCVSERGLFHCVWWSEDGRHRKQPAGEQHTASFPPTSPWSSGLQGYLYPSKARPSPKITKRGSGHGKENFWGLSS